MSSQANTIEVEIERILKVFERNCKRFKVLDGKEESNEEKSAAEKGEAHGETRKPE